MLTPEILEKIEFNKVVELYNKLNIEITAEIIERIANMDITSTSTDKMKILMQTNGTNIFNEALNKTSLISTERKRILRQLFENMVKEDIQGYKELFEYRGNPFVLSESQLKILNEGLRLTNNTLNNFTNTIAFQSQQTYVDAIDRTYMQVVSGAFDYATAIKTTIQELANKGVTLRDKLGRNVQLEVAVRRNIMSGIQFTANNINRDVEKQLGCDGYEVTAHVGARPSHAEEQGKQFALNVEDAEKYRIGLWSNVEHLWNEYNCRHTYFGIILGVSNPVYSEKELKEYKNATVNLNGKEVPYYEATQQQRQLENIIRKQKRAVQILEKAGQDTKIAKTKLAIAQRNLNDFCKNTGLQKDYSRIKIAKNSSTNGKKSDIIENTSKKMSHDILEFYEYISKNNKLDKLTTFNGNENGVVRGQELNKILNYDKLPKIVTKDEFEQLSKKSKLGKLYRGVSANTKELGNKYVNDFRYGQLYAGKGVYGNGTYVAYGKEGLKIVKNNYMNSNGQIMTMLLDNSAKTIELLKLDEMRKKEIKKIENLIPTDFKDAILMNNGYYAAIKGYDAIIIDETIANLNNQPYIIILNRGKVIINEEEL